MVKENKELTKPCETCLLFTPLPVRNNKKRGYCEPKNKIIHGCGDEPCNERVD